MQSVQDTLKDDKVRLLGDLSKLYYTDSRWVLILFLGFLCCLLSLQVNEHCKVEKIVIVYFSSEKVFEAKEKKMVIVTIFVALE